MKKFFLSILTALISIAASAQLSGNGYYRVENLATSRYLFLTDNTGDYDMSRDAGDLSAVQLWKNKDFISDPASIIYIYNASGNQYDLTGQGCGVHALTGLYVNIKEMGAGSGEYQVYGTYSGASKYLCDTETSGSDDGTFGTSKAGDYRLWYVHKVNSSSSTDYFGITPNVSVASKHYYPLFMAMPFTLTGNMKAYTVSRVDQGMAVIKPITGTIPAYTPVIIECTSTSAKNNKLDLVLPNSVSAPSDNLMKGQLFCNQSRANIDHSGKDYKALTKFDENTMRVLGVTSSGKLGFVSTSSNLYYSTRFKYNCLPANQAYLPVSKGTAAELTIVTEDEYQAIIDASKTYTLTFTVDGKTYKTETHKKGDAITAPTPTKEGYTFSGWTNLPTTMPGNDLTVTGSFTVNSYTITYTVDGQTYKTVTATYGSSLTAIAAPTKTGYTFSGWTGLPATMPAKDVTVTGTFTVNTYTITYTVDGQTYQTVTATYGSSLTAIAAPTKEGYTFSGWTGLPATMPAKDVTVTGTFKINYYTLTYVLDGVEVASYTRKYGITITPLNNPTKTGYTFSGWQNLPETMPAHDVVVTGSFKVNTYTITYTVDGQTYKTVTVDYGTTLTAIAEPTKEGYTFSGWTGLPATMPAKDITVTGTFKVNTYTITYTVDGQTYQTVTATYGSSLTAIAAPTKEGYTFSGWSTLPATMPAKDITVTGSFKVNTYTITYTVDGQTYQTVTVDYGTKLTLIDEPTKEGYTFSGWSTLPATMPAKNVTVTGTFTVNTYTITYTVDGQTYKTVTATYGSSLTPIAEPTKTGYTFSGWTGLPATMPAKDVTVTGTFTVNAYKLTYKVDGKTYQTYTVDYGTALTLIDEPTKEGYTFSGWSTLPATMPAKNVTVTGTFTVNTYTITYTVDGETYKTVTATYGSSLTPIAAPTKEGYTFSGWSEIPATMPASDISVTGSFLVNAYTITYTVDGQTYQTSTIDYGTELTLIDEPTKEGYTFSGWSTLPATMPAKNVIVTGTFKVNSYTLTYTVNGKVYSTSTVEYGSTIEPLDEPTRTGYTFSGWSEIPETMPAEDVTITGKFRTNSYTITYMVDGVVYKTVTVKYGTTITPLDEPTEEGKTFSGWNGLPTTMPAHDVTVSGSFDANSYVLTYVVDGDVYQTFTVTFGDSLQVIDEPTKEGHTFSGWTGLPATMPAENVTVSGSFTINSYVITYKVDGEVYATDTLTYGATITLIDTPTKEGYTFSGWKRYPKTMPAKDITISGNFTVNSYILTYLLDGDVYQTCTVNYGEALEAIDEPTKEGYTFSGWSTIPATMPAEDVTIAGAFTVNTYTVTYIVDGEIVHTDSVAYGEEIPEYIYTPEDQERYTFNAWVPEDGTTYTEMPAYDLVYTADIADGVSTLTAPEKVDENAIYDLSGRRLNRIPNHGAYIKNGKTYFRK